MLKSKNTAIPVFRRHYLVPTYTKSKKEALALEVFTEMFGNPITGMLFEEFVKNASALDEWLRENPPEITWNLHWPPYDTPEGHPICSTIAQSHEKAAVGTRFEGPAISVSYTHLPLPTSDLV